ncbi:MAG: serine/threonine protein kinase, partial [Coriobacteriia bacterium]|nr:serine/threonine protein kinase [Coriobacteriia bacterium]
AIKILPLQTSSGKDASPSAASAASVASKLKAEALLGLEEARTAAMLSHPNIVPLFDFEVDADRGVAYLIMEDIDGITVADIPDEYLTDEVAAAILKAVADALIYAHKNGVLHLDVKPANILINHEGQIKLADFGLAQLSHVRQQHTGKGRRGKHGKASAGTVGYMPLEQLSGEEVCEATDQWALAAVIYELLSGEYPYFEEVSRKATINTMLKAQETDEVALLDLGDLVLEGIFARALARNPEVRFDSIKDFSEALLPELGDRPAATAGKRELKKIIPELTSDDPDGHEDMDLLLRQKKQRRDKGERNFTGCLGTTASISFKILMAVALATCLLAAVAPGILQLSGNNQWLVVQVAAGVFIIGAVFGLLTAANRAAKRRR